jgi:EAL domain-containing protein (putative c-di-GMP-specific phosphodiesterase class I)
MVLPGRFLRGRAKRAGARLGDWVVQAACAHLVQLRRCGLPDLHVAINLAPRQLLKREVYGRIAALMHEAQIDPSRLVLEISENLYLREPSDIGQALQGLRDLGVRVSIDDFGTGYSSIGYLKRLPIDQVKIDKSFVRDMAINADDAAVVRGIVTLAHSLRLEVIAEGVETEAQLRLVRELGCDGAQGFYFSYPLAPDALSPFLLGHTGARRRARSEGSVSPGSRRGLISSGDACTRAQEIAIRSLLRAVRAVLGRTPFTLDRIDLVDTVCRRRAGSALRRTAGRDASCTIVPDHQVAHAPAVDVDELRLRGEFDQLLDQPASLLDGPADDVRCMRGEVQ